VRRERRLHDVAVLVNCSHDEPLRAVECRVPHQAKPLLPLRDQLSNTLVAGHTAEGTREPRRRLPHDARTGTCGESSLIGVSEMDVRFLGGRMS